MEQHRDQSPSLTAEDNQILLEESSSPVDDHSIEEGLITNDCHPMKRIPLRLDKHELSITPIPESINDEDENIDQRESSRSQVRRKKLSQ